MITIYIVFTEPKQQGYVRENRILGQLKLTLHYQRGAFMVSSILYVSFRTDVVLSYT